ncbi:MAG: hypothetical protein M1828_001124 [Chrysothrix sp. TS-e1954]|nr:MAG: hypothetical protein M1828_001124 [Chrysothrix sp. TS-e1954]
MRLKQCRLQLQRVVDVRADDPEGDSRGKGMLDQGLEPEHGREYLRGCVGGGDRERRSALVRLGDVDHHDVRGDIEAQRRDYVRPYDLEADLNWQHHDEQARVSRDGSLTVASTNRPVLPIMRMPVNTGQDPSQQRADERLGVLVRYHSGCGISTVKNTIAYGHLDLYTSLSALTMSNGADDMIKRAMIKEIDLVSLSDVGGIAVAFFFCFLSKMVSSLVSQSPINVMLELGIDWVTSVTCSDVRWFKNVIRSEDLIDSVCASTDISSVLGLILIGNMSVIMETSTTGYRMGTVIQSESSNTMDY